MYDLDTGSSRSSSSEGDVGEATSSLQPLLSTVELGGHRSAAGSLLKAQQLTILDINIQFVNSKNDGIV